MSTSSPAATVLKSPADVSLGPFRPRQPGEPSGVREAERSFHRDAVGRLEMGVWEGTTGGFEARRDGYCEVFHILSGAATLYTDGREPIELAAGDVVVTPSGWSGRWEIHEPVRKLFIVVPDLEEEGR